MPVKASIELFPDDIIAAGIVRGGDNHEFGSAYTMLAGFIVHPGGIVEIKGALSQRHFEGNQFVAIADQFARYADLSRIRWERTPGGPGNHGLNLAGWRSRKGIIANQHMKPTGDSHGPRPTH